MKVLVAKVEKWLIRSRWRKVQWCVLEAIKLKNKIIYRRTALIYIQSRVRTLVARRKYYPRIQGTMLLKTNICKVDQIRTLADSLDGGRQVALDAASKLTDSANDAILRIKMGAMNRHEIEEVNQNFIRDINSTLKSIHALAEKVGVHQILYNPLVGGIYLVSEAVE